MSKEKPTCSNPRCDYWDDQENPYGACHRTSPQYIGLAKGWWCKKCSTFQGFPLVPNYNWCGEHTSFKEWQELRDLDRRGECIEHQIPEEKR